MSRFSVSDFCTCGNPLCARCDKHHCIKRACDLGLCSVCGQEPAHLLHQAAPAGALSHGVGTLRDVQAHAFRSAAEPGAPTEGNGAKGPAAPPVEPDADYAPASEAEAWLASKLESLASDGPLTADDLARCRAETDAALDASLAACHAGADALLTERDEFRRALEMIVNYLGGLQGSARAIIFAKRILSGAGTIDNAHLVDRATKPAYPTVNGIDVEALPVVPGDDERRTLGSLVSAAAGFVDVFGPSLPLWAYAQALADYVATTPDADAKLYKLADDLKLTARRVAVATLIASWDARDARLGWLAADVIARLVGEPWRPLRPEDAATVLGLLNFEPTPERVEAVVGAWR